MGQTSYVYILWLVILAAGLWIIIGFGSTLLHAREDLAGEWELTPARPSDGVLTKGMKVEQSGRYFKITLPNEKPRQMKMIEESIVDQRFGEHKRIVLTGGGDSAVFEGRAGGDLWRFRIDSGAPNTNVEGGYVAHLVERMYPRPKPTTRRIVQATPTAEQQSSAPPRVSASN